MAREATQGRSKIPHVVVGTHIFSHSKFINLTMLCESGLC